MHNSVLLFILDIETYRMSERESEETRTEKQCNHYVECVVHIAKSRPDFLLFFVVVHFSSGAWFSLFFSIYFSIKCVLLLSIVSRTANYISASVILPNTHSEHATLDSGHKMWISRHFRVDMWQYKLRFIHTYHFYSIKFQQQRLSSNAGIKQKQQQVWALGQQLCFKIVFGQCNYTIWFEYKVDSFFETIRIHYQPDGNKVVLVALAWSCLL